MKGANKEKTMDNDTVIALWPETVDQQTSVPTINLYKNTSQGNTCLVQRTIPPEGVIAVIMGTIGILANLLSLLAIYHVSAKITTHFKLIISLACSDITIGITVMLLLLHNTINPVCHPGCCSPNARIVSTCMFAFIKAANSTGLTVCLLNLIGMAIHHYIAILKPFYYRRVLDKKYGTLMIITIWFTGTILGFSDIIFPFSDIPNSFKGMRLNFCEKVLLTKYAEEYCVFALTFIAGLIIIYTYLKIYSCVRALKLQDADTFIHTSRYKHVGSDKPACLTRSKKALVTTLFIVGVFLMCWLPLCLYEIILIIFVELNPQILIPHIPILEKVNYYLFNLLLVNVLMDPIIYAVRLRDIRQGYFRFLLRFSVCKKSQDDCKQSNASGQVEIEKTSLAGSLEMT